ncbi:ArsR/SmtB family transcription factor [Cryptosporangium phraense]|uniref:Winged helix-turn-helix transcriptional regulator n=1 Tax=Cryptosporangium phraense TaxID=2593070 RepID=A0A545AS99_9ACTN|nr:winged helix-turn-helix domain-containing protein [Cryptosporangium phraense]TQS44208.1 winged helix-turn-helix transcriptional regulator [Cryptosporangium phraense]
MDEHLEISDAAQYRALGHPLRHRLLFALGQQPATISQLAKGLDQRKGNIAHHLGVLEAAGLVRIVETRQVRGGTEHYYQRSARRISFDRPDATPVIARAVADELVSAERIGGRMRTLRLTADQAGALAAAIEKLIDGLEDAGDSAERYGVFASVWKP